MTVKELKSIAQDMGMPFTNRVLKADLISAIEENIEKAHAVALDDDWDFEILKRTEARIDRDHAEALAMNDSTYTIPGTDTVLRGDTARIMIYHMTNVHRFNPSEFRDSDGRIRLTPKQIKRCAKKLRRFMKRENLWETKVA